MKVKRLQFLVCPQRDFIGTAAELQKSLKNEFAAAADGTYTRVADGSPVLDGEGRPVSDFWGLVAVARKLHVGRDAVVRLRGDGADDPVASAVAGRLDPFADTVLRFYKPNDALAERTTVILDEDWHPRSCKEFGVFGVHCVKGSEGAKLAGKLEEHRLHARTRVIRANSLNPAATPQYGEVLDDVCFGQKTELMKCGVFGVWTHIKVEYLLLTLTTLKPWFVNVQVGVCAPLCATRDIRDHDAALAKFRDTLAYQVFDDVPSYLEWLEQPVASGTTRVERPVAV